MQRIYLNQPSPNLAASAISFFTFCQRCYIFRGDIRPNICDTSGVTRRHVLDYKTNLSNEMNRFIVIFAGQYNLSFIFSNHFRIVFFFSNSTSSRDTPHCSHSPLPYYHRNWTKSSRLSKKQRADRRVVFPRQFRIDTYNRVALSASRTQVIK